MTENNKKKKKKEEEETILDPYTQMSTGDLISKIKERHSDTPEAENKREERVDDVTNAKGAIDDIEINYLKHKDRRGEHARYKGRPKSYMLSKENTKQEATELIYRMALESIRQHFRHSGKGGEEAGEKAVELYKNKPYMIRQFIASKGIDFDKLRLEMIENRRNFTKGEMYEEFKKRLPTIDDLVEENAIEGELKTDQNHYKPMLEKINKEIGEKTDLEIKYGVEAPIAIDLYKTFLREGKFSEAHKRVHKKHFQKYKHAD